MDSSPPRVRHPEWLVAPFVTLAAVVALLVIARGYDRLPVQPPECGFKTALGIPCVGCGGTRSMRALANGRVAEAAHFNPAVVLGVVVSFVWAVTGWLRYRRGERPSSRPEENRRIVRNVIIVAVILVLNWIYLLVFLP